MLEEAVSFYVPGWDRAHWISHLEAHYARFLADYIREMMNDGQDAIDKGVNPLVVWKVAHESLLTSALESRHAVETARMVPDDVLADYVRHKTLPDWVRAMEGKGFTWDDKTYRWNPPD